MRESYILDEMSATQTPELVANWLGALAVAVVAVQREAVAEVGSDSRAAAMLTLQEFPQIPVGELADVLQLTHSAGVRLVDGLGADGLVERARAESDSRRAELTLTPAGRRIARRLQDHRIQALERFLSPLSSEERKHFGLLTERLLGGVAPDRITARNTCRYCHHRICDGPDCPIGGSVQA
jgi:DNA-binding MarR family transcriptional regulator